MSDLVVESVDQIIEDVARHSPVAFQAFKYTIGGTQRRLLAIFDSSRNVHIVDDLGNNYGKWFDIASFKKHVDQDDKQSAWVVGTCAVSIRSLS